MTKQEILEQYDVDKHGIIKDPGKFEGEMLYAPYFYDAGGGDDTVYDGDTPIDIFIIEGEDLAEFPELKGTYAVALSESDQGFINLEHFFSKKDFDEAMEEFEESQEEDEE